MAIEQLILDGLPLNGPGGPTVTNLVGNPSIEVATTGWAASAHFNNVGAVLTRVTTPTPQSGTGALRVVTDGLLSAEGAEYDLASIGTFTSGLPYTFSVYLRGNAGGESVSLILGVAADLAQTATFPLTTSWVRYSITWTPTANRTGVGLDIARSTAPTTTFFVDAAMVVQASAAANPAYFDGSTPGYYWTGTAHGSTSVSSPLFLESVEFPPPPRLEEWVRGSDSDGSLLARSALADNREITCRVRVEPQTSMDTALAQVGTLLDKLQEAERNPAGIDLVWTPADATKTITFKVLSGEVTGLPVTLSGDDAGWYVSAPVVTIKLTCFPFGYGAEVVGTPASSTLPVVTTELTAIPGDVPAEGRLIVTDNATQTRRLMRWGLESRNYPTSSPPTLILDSDSLSITGFSGAQTTRSGAYDPNATGNNVIRGTLASQVATVCGTGDQTHIGTYRVFARIWAAANTTGTVMARFTWQDGDGPLRSNTYASPAIVNGFAEVDLGLITITEKVLGAQRWNGRVEGYSTVVGETLDVDYLSLIPAGEGYGTAIATYSYKPGILVARDEFTSIGATTALNARTSPLGGSWTTSGGTTDFTAADAPLASDETMTRVAAVGAARRYAVLATSYTDVEAGVSHYRTIGSSTYGDQGVLARWTDASNHLYFGLTASPSGNLYLAKVVAGVTTTLKDFSQLGISALTVAPVATWMALRIVVYAQGNGYVSALDASGSVLASVAFSDPDLATGGTLATGKVGIFDYPGLNTPTGSRYYDNFYAATPAAQPVTIYPSQSIEVRSDSTLREDATGTYWGQPPAYRGSRFTVPVAGTRGRESRVAVVARRNDTTASADDQIADSTTVQVNYTPRYLLIPR